MFAFYCSYDYLHKEATRDTIWIRLLDGMRRSFILDRWHRHSNERIVSRLQATINWKTKNIFPDGCCWYLSINIELIQTYRANSNSFSMISWMISMSSCRSAMCVLGILSFPIAHYTSFLAILSFEVINCWKDFFLTRISLRAAWIVSSLLIHLWWKKNLIIVRFRGKERERRKSDRSIK